PPAALHPFPTRRSSDLSGFAALYERRVNLAIKRPVALLGQLLTPILWVLVVGPALASAFGGFAHGVNYFTYISVGQIVFVLPFSDRKSTRLNSSHRTIS